MNQYIVALVFIFIGLFGAYLHYVKDRYLEKKIDCNLWFYLTNNPKSTYNMVQAIIASAIPLAMTHDNGLMLSLGEVYGMIGAGYSFDSLLNHAYPPRDSHE